jgi:phosphopantothenoylcysteine synthetase/decarboxylase
MRFLITAGGTREYIDPVRFICNASSGKMGYALARAAAGKGHAVTLISIPTNLKPPISAKIISVQTSSEMFEAVKKNFGWCDCLIMAAAVSDFTVARTAKSKIKKTNQALTLQLKPTADILKWAGKNKRDKIIVGFALQDKAIRTEAQKKLKEKNLDMIIANTPAAIGAERSTVHIKTQSDQWLQIGPAGKNTIARKIISITEAL